MKLKTKARPLNLRDFPDDLYWLAKECAANHRKSLKAYIISAIEAATERDSGRLVSKRRDGKES